MDKETVIYSCLEHVEMAIDDFVNNTEAAPEVLKIQNEKCSYCKEDAQYEIKK